MGLCLSKQRRQLGGRTVEDGDRRKNKQDRDVRQCSSLLERELSAEECVWFLSRHHKKGLFDLPYHLRGKVALPRLTQAAKEIIDSSKGDDGKPRVSIVNKKEKREDWMIDVSQRYELFSTIGMGGTSTVWLGKDITTEKEVAVKVLKRPISDDDLPMLFNELLVGSQSWFEDTVMDSQVPRDSIFLCHTKSIFLTRHCYGVVMELARGGNLAEYVSATCGKHVTSTGERVPLAVDEEQARFIFKQLLCGIRHMHENMHTAHRDIKLDNTVIMDSWMKNNSIGTAEHCVGRISFVDFQFAYHYNQNSPIIRYKGLLGTPVYMSPELLALRFDRQQSTHQYDPISSDIWACGILLVALLFGSFPFDDKSPRTMEDLERSIYDKQKRQSWKDAEGIAPYVQYATSECIDLLDGILELDPSKRSSITKIEMHPWMKKPFESKFLETEWKNIQKQIQAHREDMCSSFSFDKDTKDQVSSILKARNKAVKKLIEIASKPYDKKTAVLDQDHEPENVESKVHDDWSVFHAPEIVGLVDHRSFTDDHSLEISLDMHDIYSIVEQGQTT